MILNPAHILEVALLLLASFLAGAVIGSLARVLALRLARGKPTEEIAAPAPAAVVVAEPQPALVTTPVIEPVAKPAQPAAPSDVPVPDFAEVIALTASAVEAPVIEAQPPRLELVPSATRPEAAMAPARVAGQTTSGLLVPSPRIVEQARVQVETNGPGADVIPFPTDRGPGPAEIESSAEAAVAPEQLPAAGHAQADPTPVLEDAPAQIDGFEPPASVPAIDEVAEPPSAEAALAAVAPAEQTQVPATESSARNLDDEAAAMRAIEGGWAPKRSAARRATKAPRPEGIAEDEPASSRRPEPVDKTPGRPVGIEGPRNGAKDNLTNIIGVLPVIETSLNQAGIYHFDQIADFSDENVAWLEGHLGIGGRIDREHWREQARELAIVSERARKVAGK